MWPIASASWEGVISALTPNMGAPRCSPRSLTAGSASLLNMITGIEFVDGSAWRLSFEYVEPLCQAGGSPGR